MVSEAEIERLQLEADTIMTRYQTVEAALIKARNEEGDHWEDEQLSLQLDSPHGDTLSVILDLHADPATNAEQRYDRAKELEAELEQQQKIVGQLAPLPADPVAYLICYHLDAVEGNYPRSMAGHLDADRTHIEELCAEMLQAELLERIESGTVKQRRVKAKKTDEVRQHHTYYRLSRDGDHLLRFLAEQEGQLNVLRHLLDGQRLVRRLARGGPDYARMTADEFEMDFEYVRHLYRALRRVGLVTEYEGSTTKASERKLKPKAETHRKHTYFVTTDRAESLLRELDRE